MVLSRRRCAMRMRFSGVLAVTLATAGMLWCCSESPSEISTTEDDFSSNSSSDDTGNEHPGDGASSGEMSTPHSSGISTGTSSPDAGTSSSGSHRGRSSGNVAGSSGNGSTPAQSSSSATEFTYVAPANFADTVNAFPAAPTRAGATTAPNKTRFTRRLRTK